jgi:phosphatidylinositol-3-phosphatase
MHRARVFGAVPAALLVSLCGACGPAAAPVTTAAPPTASSFAQSPPPASAPGQPARVVVIVMENRAYESVVGLPYIRSLATTATVLTDYHASGHPSLPNYLALTSGSTWGIADDGYHVLPEQDIGDQLSVSGLPWRAYMEGMGMDCRQSAGRYAVKHDPFAYYGGRCPRSVVAFSQLSTDLGSATPPRFLWITPDLCNDMHDCSSNVGDSWLQRTVPGLLASPAMSNGVLFITWDENDGGGANHVLTLVLGSKRPTSPANPYSHPALVATIEDLLGVPRLPATQTIAAIALH